MATTKMNEWWTTIFFFIIIAVRREFKVSFNFGFGHFDPLKTVLLQISWTKKCLCLFIYLSILYIYLSIIYLHMYHGYPSPISAWLDAHTGFSRLSRQSKMTQAELPILWSRQWMRQAVLAWQSTRTHVRKKNCDRQTVGGDRRTDGSSRVMSRYKPPTLPSLHAFFKNPYWFEETSLGVCACESKSDFMGGRI